MRPKALPSWSAVSIGVPEVSESSVDDFRACDRPTLKACHPPVQFPTVGHKLTRSVYGQHLRVPRL